MVTFDQLMAWAGAEKVARADPGIVSGWRIPETAKALLVEVGIPVTPRLIEHVEMQSETTPTLHTACGRSLYCLTYDYDGGTSTERPSSFGVAPETGAVYYVMPPGDAWFANSSIDLWLRTLHHYGRHVTESELLSEPDGPEEHLSGEDEENAIVELACLAEELKKIDPPAFDGYVGFIWPELLDRWLY
ncbi:SUKH-4 family immunity protein [Streptomyces sp. NPDC048275]|uniref:SUKH-4 family immunity protein n=1 Tax=Streptomyces sp. NPDC048275 TaxID=3155629 RepID=UPI0033C012DC